jgi:tripartite-type tricarboxylate transporter receptor subunit TctC
LAVTTPQRLEVLPEVPTTAEAGFPGVEMQVWFGIKGPAGMPAAVVRQLSDAMVDIVQQPDFVTQLRTLGAAPAPLGAAAFGEFSTAETRRWTGIIRQAGVTAAD